jgi:Cys-tRNA(Pro)/Cys-tRNA(Cys) deacylase
MKAHHGKSKKGRVHSSGTRATTALTKAGIEFTTHTYEVDSTSDSGYALDAAADLGVPASVVFKTLVTRVDGAPTLALIPADQQLDLKALANCVGGSKAVMADAADAERLTGYVVGGISPVATKRRLPAVADTSLVGQESVYVSAGKRGVQVELAPSALIELLNIRSAPIARRH